MILVKELNYKYLFSSYYCIVLGIEDISINQTPQKEEFLPPLNVLPLCATQFKK